MEEFPIIRIKIYTYWPSATGVCLRFERHSDCKFITNHERQSDGIHAGSLWRVVMELPWRFSRWVQNAPNKKLLLAASTSETRSL